MNPQDQSSDASEPRHGARSGETGQVITPGANASPQPSPTLPAPVDPSSAPQTPPPSPPAPPAPEQKQEEQHFFHAEDAEDPKQSVEEPEPQEYASPAPNSPEQAHYDGSEVAWTASEFIAHQKSTGWFVAMGGAGVLIAGLVYLITRDIFNTVIVAIAVIIFGVAAGRQPRQMQYLIDDHGIAIGRRHYPYADFRSFSTVDDGPLRSIVLMPLKRFMPQLSIYYDPADEDRITEVLSAHLPMHEHKHDMTEQLMRRIRF